MTRNTPLLQSVGSGVNFESLTKRLFALSDTSRENGDIASVMKSEHMFGETRASREHLAPSATVANHGRGPSQAADFFSARGAPTILKVIQKGFALRQPMTIACRLRCAHG